jgi:hypothetical protein
MGRMHWIIAMLALGSLAVGGSAVAGAGGGIGTGFAFAPGQQGTSPDKVFDDARPSDTAPGNLYLQNKSNDPNTAPHLGRLSAITGSERIGGIGR